MQVYVSGSIRDTDRVQYLQERLRKAGHQITHDWTRWSGDKFSDAAYDEAARQLRAVADSDVVVVVEHPAGKAMWMELGAAVASDKPVVVVPHDDVSPSLWYALEHVSLLGPYEVEQAVAMVGP